MGGGGNARSGRRGLQFSGIVSSNKGLGGPETAGCSASPREKGGSEGWEQMNVFV